MTLVERLRSANVELWTVGVRGAMNVLVDPRPLLDEAATALATAEQQLSEARRLLREIGGTWSAQWQARLCVECGWQETIHDAGCKLGAFLAAHGGAKPDQPKERTK